MNWRLIFIFLGLICAINGSVSAQKRIELADTAQYENPEGIALSTVSFRGLSVVDDKVIWASGSKGAFARSTNGGKTFAIHQIPGYEKSDFRDIEAFDENVAIVMSSGSPAYILKTFDGGQIWKKVFEDNRKEMFLDAMDFWDENNGVVIGDPIDERFVLYRTLDAGNTWYPFDTTMRPYAVKGESLFAASGTCFRCMPNNSIAFVTGGSKSIFHWLQIDKKYSRIDLKFSNQGKSSEGAYSFDFNKNIIIVVGGDYTNDTAKVKHGFYGYNIDEYGLHLMNQKPFYSNYRSSVELLPKGNFITCGTKGVDFNNTEQTINISNSESLVSNQSFNVVRKAKKGKLVVLAGNKGKIGLLRN